MARLQRRMRFEHLESRSLLAATIGIADVIMDAGSPEGQVVASLEIDNAAGLRGANVEIHYDQKLLQADLGSIRAGSIWDGMAVAIANVNDQEGTITAFVFATQDMSLSSGSLLDIDFLFHDDTAGNARANIGVGNLRLNEGEIPISSVPIQGQTAIDGSITRKGSPIGGDSSLSPASLLEQVTRLPVKGPSLREHLAAVERSPIASPISDNAASLALDKQRPLPSSTPLPEPIARLFCGPRARHGHAFAPRPQTTAERAESGALIPALSELTIGPQPASDTAAGTPASPDRSSMHTLTLVGIAAPESATTPGLPGAALAAPLVVESKPSAELIDVVNATPTAQKEIGIVAALSNVRRAASLSPSALGMLSDRRAGGTISIHDDAPHADPET